MVAYNFFINNEMETNNQKNQLYGKIIKCKLLV